MLTIEVELLTGRYAATAYNDRSSAEWPPHPARFFSALVAALHEQEPANPDERAALLWLERLPPPALEVDLAARRRDVHDTYVPVNDVTIVGDPEEALRGARAARSALGAASTKETKKADKVVADAEKKLAEFIAAQQVPDEKPSKEHLARALALLPERRTRQVRTFPVVIPARPVFAFHWDADPKEHKAAIGALCARVTRLGHSSSLVRCALVERTPEVNLVPNETGEEVLRTVGPGQLEQLEAAHRRHRQIEQRILPSRPHRYGPPLADGAAELPTTVFSDEWIVFRRIGGDRLLSSRTTDLCKALRAALIEEADGSLPASLSGHVPNGQRADVPHVAFIAPPFVGRQHADGSIQGCAIVPPRNLSPEDWTKLKRVVAEWEKRTAKDDSVELGGSGFKMLLARTTEAPVLALSETRWCRPSRRFVTATPIALDKYPGNLRSNQDRTAEKAAREAAGFIADACVNIGLPRPASVEISQAPLLPGTQPVSAFRPAAPVPGRPPRVRVHADIVFSEKVRGPVLLGASRYFGLGLCLPVTEET